MALLAAVVLSILYVSFVSGASSDATESVTVAADYPWWRQTTVYNDVRVRLVNGSYHSGRVEVYHDGQWGTICSDGFDHNAARVICRMLGYYRGLYEVTARYNGYYGEGDGPIMIDDIHCYGYENNIRDCSSSKWFTSNCKHAEDVGVDCNSYNYGDFTNEPNSQYTAPWKDYTIDYNNVNDTAKEGQVRLVNGTSYYNGRVEVYSKGRWGTICDDSFDRDDAIVICRMLGLYQGSGYVRAYSDAHFGRGNGPIIIDDLRCGGYESNITECLSNPWFSHNCGHSEDAGVDCYDDVRVRLVNGGYHSGRVEVYYDGQWGTICDDGFDHNAAVVICRMLGYYSNSYHVTARYNRHYGEGDGPIMIDDIHCYGNENNIRNCTSSKWFTSNCIHAEDVGVDCNSYNGYSTEVPPRYTPVMKDYTVDYSNVNDTDTEGDVRLVDGTSYYNGRVEVYSQGRWGKICDDGFDHNDVKVICRMLGLYQGSSYGRAYTNGYFGLGNGPVVVSDLRCNGYERNISECSSAEWFRGYCSYMHGTAGVDCYAYYEESTTPYYPWWVRETTDLPATAGYEGQVRLVDGNYYSGRVEVYSRGQWGTICDDNFDHNDVKAICRMLGLYQGNSYGTFYTIGNGNGPIIIDGLECNGYESEIKHCSSNPWFSHDCSHSEDVGINCYAYWADMTTGSWWWQYPTTAPGYRVQDAVTVSCNENGWDIQVDMNTLRLLNPMARASDIYLGENSCTGIESWHTLTFTQGLRECLTSEMIRNNELVYRNELVYAERDPQHPYIIRHYNWTVGIECDVMRNESASGHLHHDSNHNQLPQVSGTSHYTVNMTFYSDPNFQNELPYPLPVSVGQNVYTKIYTTTSDWTIRMRVHTCYTKPSQYAADHLKYYIIKNGCEVDSNTHIISQSSHETRIVFQDFEYTNNKEGLYVFCDATFCSSQDYSRQCQQTCVPVVKRNIHVKTETVTEDPLFDSETTQVNGSG